MERFGIREQNENGDCLVGLLSAVCLFYGNSFFENRENRRWTSESPNGRTNAETDHTLMNRKCHFDTTLATGFFAGSDHRLLRAKIRFNDKLENSSYYSPKKNETGSVRRRYSQ